MNLPPIGIMPRNIWEEKRFYDLQETILRYAKEGFTINPEWIEEYNQFIKDRKC